MSRISSYYSIIRNRFCYNSPRSYYYATTNSLYIRTNGHSCTYPNIISNN